MADKHADTRTGTPARPGLTNRQPTAERSVMHGQLRKRSAAHYRTERQREQLARDDGIVTADLNLPLDAHPAVLIELAVERWGPRGLMDRCVRLYREMDWGGEPELMSYLAGSAGPRWVELGFGTQSYFVRTWALRAMLYAWDESASTTVIDALKDEHWRPREMALKVIAKRLIDGDVDAVARLRDDDPIPRVQAAARRALGRLSRDLRMRSAKQ
jgi:hypothetical protein